MKKYANLLILGLLVIVFTTSCEETQNTMAMENSLDVTEITTREGQNQSIQVNFQGQTLTIDATDVISMRAMSAEENADAQAVMSINQALMGTEKEAQLLEVNFTMSDEPVENGMFIFGIETEDAKNLTLEMFDEEGYAMVANNKFEITEGNNYKALNVNSLENGTYNFRLKDDAGKELNKQVTVAAE